MRRHPNKPRKSIILVSLGLIFTVLFSVIYLSLTNAMETYTSKYPEDTWSPETLQKEFPNLTSPGIIYLQITGVNTSSKETYAAYVRGKKTLKTMNLNVSSHYEFQNEISSEASEVALISLKNATKFMTEVYNTISSANQSFGMLLTQSFKIYPLFKLLNSTLPGLRKTYTESYLNASQTQLRFLKIQKILNESSKEYISIHQNLSAAQSVTNNLTSGVIDFNNHLESLQENYTTTFLRVIWTYKGLRDLIKAYEIGSAYPCKVASLSLYLHLPEDFIYKVFYATYPAYKESGYAGITDELLANITINFVLDRMNASPYKTFDREFGKSFVLMVMAYDTKQRSRTSIIDNTQNQVDVLSQLIKETLNELPSLLSSSSLNYYFPYLGNVSGQTMRFILNEIESQRKPQESAIEIALALNVHGIPREYYLTLSTNASIDSVERSLLNEIVSQKLPNDMKRFSSNISEVIIKYEKRNGYAGVLSSNPEILKNATLEVITIMSQGQRPEELTDSEELSPEKAATNAVSHILKEILSNSSVDVPSTFLNITAETIARYPSKKQGEKSQQEILSAIFTRAFNQYSGTLVMKFYSEASPKEAALHVFYESLLPKFISNSSPENSHLIRRLLQDIPREYPLTKSHLKELSLNATILKVNSWEPKILGRTVTLPAMRITEIAWEFRGNSNLITESDVSGISKKIYETAMRVHRDQVLALKGPKNDSFIVVVKTKNGTSNIIPEKVERAFSSSFNLVTPSTKVRELAPLNLRPSHSQEHSGLSMLIIAIILIGWLTLLVTLRGPLLATVIPSLTVFGVLELLSETIYKTMTFDNTTIIIGVVFTSSSAFAVSYCIIESFRRSLAIATSEGISVLETARESTYGILTITALSGTSAILLELPIIESIVVTLLTAVPVFLALNALLLISTRSLGDKLVFWWPMSAEIVLRNENNGREGLLKKGFAVFIISLITTGSIASLLNYRESPGITLYGSNVYILLSNGSKIGEKDFQIVQQIAESIASLNGIDGVYTLTRPYGVPLNLSAEELMNTWGSDYVSKDKKAVLIVVKIRAKNLPNIENLIRDKLNEIIRSNPAIKEVSYENGIVVLETQ